MSYLGFDSSEFSALLSSEPEQKELHKQNKPDVSCVVTGLSSLLGIRHKIISIQDASADYSQYLFAPYFQFPYVLYSEGLSKC